MSALRQFCRQVLVTLSLFVYVTLYLLKSLLYLARALVPRINSWNSFVFLHIYIDKVIPKSLWDFRLLRYCRRNGHAEGGHVNRGRDSPSFCPTLQVIDMSTLGDAADVNPVIKFLPHMCNVCGRNLITELTSAASPRVDISSRYKVGQKLGVSLPLLTCSPSAWPSRLLYRRGQKSRRDLWITLYFWKLKCDQI